MSMILEKGKNLIKVLIPNSEATISAQIKNIKDSEVTGYYTNDKIDIKKEIIDFLKNDNYEYILCVNDVLDVINKLSKYKSEFGEIYKDSMNSLDESYEYFKDKDNKFIKIPKMYYSGIDNRYFKFDNQHHLIKKLRSILYGDITGFNIVKNDANEYYIVSPFVRDNILDILQKRKEKLLEEENKYISYWTYTPGENGAEWEYCFENNKMVLGFDELGDLREYKNEDDILNKLIELGYGDNPVMTKCSCNDFINNIKAGDVIIAKIGQKKLLGYGEVIDNKYIYDSNKKKYKNIRNVKWLKKGEWEVPDKLKMAVKTLTNISGLNAGDNLFTIALLNIMNGDECSMKEIFKNWLLENGLQSSSVNAYIGTINLTTKEAIEDQILSKDIFEINDIIELDQLIEKLLTNDKFLKRKEIGHNQNTSSLNHYRQFLMDYIKIQNNENKNETYDKNKFLNEVFIDENKYNSIVSILEKKKNIILEGAPGVGKTFMAKRLAYSIIGAKDNSKVELIQFHQSYSYEDFIEGYRPSDDGFELRRGLFYKLCNKASNDKDNNYYIIIDEINRGNLSKIFGELLMLIESDKRGEELTLVYSEEKFSVPENLYIIGLMNTADRSLALIDYALRRRFSFIKIEPAFENQKFIKTFNEKFDNKFNNIIDVIKKINEAIEQDKSLGAGFKIGHSYFCPNLKDRKGNKKDIEDIIMYEIVPLLEEYWYDDEESIIQWKSSLNSTLNGVLND